MTLTIVVTYPQTESILFFRIRVLLHSAELIQQHPSFSIKDTPFYLSVAIVSGKSGGLFCKIIRLKL